MGVPGDEGVWMMRESVAPRPATSWTERMAAMQHLVAAQELLVAEQSKADLARTQRDSAIRAARQAGFTYDQIIARLGVSSATILQAVRRG